ncbi:hypothetical protein LJB86_02600 [Deltaproteobacteria bacterium OttesenSCG-928-M10]|nr:hypothetical protein [Deltaproteobacteria bacterium OttesenSCG-928-M10]
MSKNRLITEMLELLNFPENPSLEDMRSFLIKYGFCHDELVLTEDESRYYSLLTRQEVLDRKASNAKVSYALSLATDPIDENRTYSILAGSPKEYRECVKFPEDDDALALKQAFKKVMVWFQTFMAGCTAGVMDVATLNKYKTTRALIMEFRPTKDPMNPLLAPVGLRDDGFDLPIERAIILSWIYPFIFSGNGKELAKMRRCRQCGKFFLGVRLSAAFCSTKCRMAYNYANRS